MFWIFYTREREAEREIGKTMDVIMCRRGGGGGENEEEIFLHHTHHCPRQNLDRRGGGENFHEGEGGERENEENEN